MGKSLEDHLRIPRDDRGERFYTDFEMNIIRNVKPMRDKGLTFEIIKQVLSASEAAPTAPIPAIPVMSQSEAIQTIRDLQQTIEVLSKRMESIIKESVQNQVSKLTESLDDQNQHIDQTQPTTSEDPPQPSNEDELYSGLDSSKF
ncbi:MerR family transcriptional regulator [Paenibacillus lautus]|uniref:MerR family transcriptional regulator n=1 Tax=Paenibacillus lautus TaxID=1401 RepID=UPI002DB9C80F|nr:MerR family transcriptional regulator [Paenibacillus lautus]MEC0259359.1 MerR family transcriptional regulator [Paenibacillus lautus]